MLEASFKKWLIDLLYFVFISTGPRQRKTVFNNQGQIQLGGVWNPTLGRVEKPFQVNN